MSLGTVRGMDLLAVSAALLACLMAGAYIVVMRDQGDAPLVWVLCILIGGAVLAAYGTPLAAPHRRAALAGAGLALIGLGFLAILSIGLPILIAGAFALASAARPDV